MPLNLQELMAARGAEKFPLFDRYLNSQLVRVLKTIGFDVDYVRGEGPYLFDAAGNRYLDLLSGFGVFAVGRNHPTIAGALRQVLDAQLAGLVQMDVSLLAGLLAERLIARLPYLDKVFFCNSGTEAVEGAIKFARAATRRAKIVYCDHAFHGLTMGALSLNGDPLFRDGFEPLLATARACRSTTFWRWSGHCRAVMSPPSCSSRSRARGSTCRTPATSPRRSGSAASTARLFVADEIQTGLGRTGRFLACEHWGVEPDMVLLAKALSGGFAPVGAIVMRRSIFAKMFDRMDRAVVHGSTFAKNDMAMAAGLATLAVLDDEKLIERAADLGEGLIGTLRQRLEGFEFVKDVRGKGLMIAIEFGPPKSLKLRAAYAMLDKANKGLFCQLILIPLFKRHRILAQVAGHAMPVIKLLPPLVLSEADAEWIASAFEDVVGESHALGAVWDLGRTLAGHALKSRAGAA